jgi:hypothetical protein
MPGAEKNRLPEALYITVGKMAAGQLINVSIE